MSAAFGDAPREGQEQEREFLSQQRDGDGDGKDDGDRTDANSDFECNICLSQASDPVITLCGHLYWPCLYQVLPTHHVRCGC
jgi:hypothetical protein